LFSLPPGRGMPPTATTSWRPAAVRVLGRCLLGCSLARAGAVALDGDDKRPNAEALLVHAAAPLVARWVSSNSISALAAPEAPCAFIFVTLDWIVERLHGRYRTLRSEVHEWQDLLVVAAYGGQTAHEFFRSPGYHALLYHALTLHRLCLNTMDFVEAVALLHGERCFHPELRDALGPPVLALSEVSAEAHRMQLAAVYKGLFSFWDRSSDVLRHVEPVWNLVAHAAKFADSMAQVRVVLDKLRTPEGTLALVPAGEADWQDEGGAFSQMNFLSRNLTGGWHLDHGLLASLLRLWRPPEEAGRPGGAGGEGCHTTVADFGAGSGHYCGFLNRTEEFCCLAFDGTPRVAELTGGAVQTQRLDEPFNLGRRFDWVMCLEVAEHIPRESEATVLGNLRRHAGRGLVLSWSEEPGEAHPNSRPWPEVREALESVGFVLDEAASAGMRPRVPWLKGAVRIFRTS